MIGDIRAKAQWNYADQRMSSLLRCLATDGTAAMIWYRLMQWSRRWKIGPVESLCNKLCAIGCQCIIGRGADFGERFVLIHSQGVVINGAVRGGNDVYIEHQVTIGAERQQSPRLGSRIFIGAGAKLLGPIQIGDGAKVGANAVVIEDVPAGATVVGIPAKVVKLAGTTACDKEPVRLT